VTLDSATVLVTGGAGFVGSHVIHDLLDSGGSVHVLDNLHAGKASHVPTDATLHEVDLRDAADVSETVHAVAPDVVVHLAALHYIPYCNDNPEEAFDVNVMGTRHLLDAARDLDDLERVIYSSTAAVYPPRDEPHAVTDATGAMDVYGRTKLVGEDLLELFHRETGVPAASARLFNVYGPNETNPHLIPAILEQIEDGTREIDLGNLTPKRDFIYAGDVASALAELVSTERDGHRTYNVGTGRAWSVREVVEQVSEALGEPIEIEQDEDRIRESDRPHLCADTSRIERETDWQPETEFVDGLRRLVDTEGITA
jgi:UDP-glucose 4-epimerase